MPNGPQVQGINLIAQRNAAAAVVTTTGGVVAFAGVQSPIFATVGHPAAPVLGTLRWTISDAFADAAYCVTAIGVITATNVPVFMSIIARAGGAFTTLSSDVLGAPIDLNAVNTRIELILSHE